MRIIDLCGCKPIEPGKVKPCPFCGGEPMLKETGRWPGKVQKAIDGFTVVCIDTKCVIFDSDGQYYRTREQAIKRWDERAVV